MAREIIQVAIDGSSDGIIFLLCMIFTSFAITSFVIFVCGLSSRGSPKRKESDSDDDHRREPHYGQEKVDAIETAPKPVRKPQILPPHQHGRGGGGGGGGARSSTSGGGSSGYGGGVCLGWVGGGYVGGVDTSDCHRGHGHHGHHGGYVGGADISNCHGHHGHHH